MTYETRFSDIVNKSDTDSWEGGKLAESYDFQDSCVERDFWLQHSWGKIQSMMSRKNNQQNQTEEWQRLKNWQTSILKVIIIFQMCKCQSNVWAC